MLSNTARTEKHFAKMVEKATPDVFPGILLTLQNKKGRENTMENTVYMPQMAEEITIEEKKKGKKTLFKTLAALAAALVVAVGLGMAYLNYSVDSVIGLDVNPSIQIKVNRAEKVLSVDLLNEDAKVIIGDMQLKNVDLDVAVNAIIGSMVTNGYISEANNSILISVENANLAKGEKLQTRLADEVNALLTQNAVNGAVISQTLAEDAELKTLAEQYGISLGKAALVDMVVKQDPTLTFADIAPLSINDIYLLVASQQSTLQGITASGQANANKYIGEAKAKSIALSHAGLQESNLLSTEIKLAYDSHRMIYKIELETAYAEYEYKLDALTGNILKYEKDGQDMPDNSAVTVSDSTPSQSAPSQNIDEAAAKAAALAHAGVAESAATYIKIEKDTHNGILVYEVEFYAGNTEYEYKINAQTGEVVEYEKEQKNSSNHGGAGGGTGTNYIGEGQAKAIAFAHANVTEGSTGKMECTLKNKKGSMVYSIEFECGRSEYEYKIDACTGKIIESNVDHHTEYDTNHHGGHHG